MSRRLTRKTPAEQKKKNEKEKHEKGGEAHYKSMGFVADSSLPWFRGFLGEPR